MKIKISRNEHLKVIRPEWYRIININDGILKINLIKNRKRYELNWWIQNYTIDYNQKDKKVLYIRMGLFSYSKYHFNKQNTSHKWNNQTILS